MPDPGKLLRTLELARTAFTQTPRRIGRFTQLAPEAEVLVVGDMHGHLDNFRRLLQAVQLAQHPHRHLVVQELVHGPFFYPQGGDKSHQLLDLVAALKCQYPERVHYLLGNHELAQWQKHRIGKGDVDQNEQFKAGVQQAYGSFAEPIFLAYDHLFAQLDLALRTANRVFLSHTYPSSQHLDAWNLTDLQREEFQPDDFRLGGLVHSLVWDRDHRPENAEAFLQKVDADWIITGHIPTDQGYTVPNLRQIILDAKGSPACYCLFPTDRPATLEDLLAGVQVL